MNDRAEHGGLLTAGAFPRPDARRAVELPRRAPRSRASTRADRASTRANRASTRAGCASTRVEAPLVERGNYRGAANLQGVELAPTHAGIRNAKPLFAQLLSSPVGDCADINHRIGPARGMPRPRRDRMR